MTSNQEVKKVHDSQPRYQKELIMPRGMNATPILPETGFIRLPKVLELIPVSRSTWWAGVANGHFPKPCKPTPRTSAWKCEDIRELIEVISRTDHE